MKIEAIKTVRVAVGGPTLIKLLDKYVVDMRPGSVLAITSKIVSLCEGNVIPMEGIDKTALVRQQAQLYLDDDVTSKWNVHFTITDDMIIPHAGIDESNADGVYVLWPRDAQATANQVRVYLAERFHTSEVGVVITDSTCRPLRQGVSGIALAFSGFQPLNNYIGQPDLYGQPFKVSQADIVGGIAAAAVLVMGEGAESTPLALLSEVTMAQFVGRNPTSDELVAIHIALEDDLFAPFLQNIPWQQGGHAQQAMRPPSSKIDL